MESRLQPKTKILPQFIAIAGGSGAGKSWLAERLQRAFGKEATVLSLDNFYRDRSHLSAARRQQINFDNPKAINWPLLKEVLQTCITGQKAFFPEYDFASHSVTTKRLVLSPKRFVILEGMWLLRPSWLRHMLFFSIYVDCPQATRRSRRLQRDQSQRGRTRASICHQFDSCVTPMHRKYVEPQKRRAEIILTSPLKASDVQRLVRRIQTHVQRSYDQS